MKKILLLSLSLICLTGFAQTLTPKPKGSTQCYYGYYEYLPVGYDTLENLPVIIALHGIGEKGNGTTDLGKVLRAGVGLYLSQKKSFTEPTIVLLPQHNDGWWNSTGADIMLKLAARYKIDPNRIYVTGFSAGGYGTWVFGQSYPEKLAAIIPICGCGSTSLGYKMKDLPMWIFHSNNDPTVQFSCSSRMFDAVKAAGGSPRNTWYNSNLHNCWDRTYNDPDTWKWLLAQRLGGTKATEENTSTTNTIDATAFVRKRLGEIDSVFAAGGRIVIK